MEKFLREIRRLRNNMVEVLRDDQGGAMAGIVVVMLGAAAPYGLLIGFGLGMTFSSMLDWYFGKEKRCR